MAFKRFTKSEATLRPDPRLDSTLVSKFINSMMWQGKKTVAERIFYEAIDIVEKKVTDVKPIVVFETAIENVKPQVEVRSRRVGGANYQVPVPVAKKRQQSLAIRWMLSACRDGKGRKMSEKLAEEILAAYQKQGKAVTTRENTHKMAESNKAFAHFAW